MSKYVAVIYRDRSYPEGDDVCIGQIPFDSFCEKDNLFTIETDYGVKYSLTPINWIGNELHGKNLKKL